MVKSVAEQLRLVFGDGVTAHLEPDLVDAPDDVADEIAEDGHGDADRDEDEDADLFDDVDDVCRDD